MDPERFWLNVVGARRREGTVLDSSRPRAQSVEEARKEEDEDERTLMALRAKLSDLVARRQVLDGNLALINARIRYLRGDPERRFLVQIEGERSLSESGCRTRTRYLASRRAVRAGRTARV